MTQPSSLIQSWVSTRLGQEMKWVDRSWPHGVSRVWKGTHGEGSVFLKQHTQPRKFQQELRCYRDWLAPFMRDQTPELLGSLGEPTCALLLSACAGLEPRPQSLTPCEEQVAFRRAGAFLGRLHNLPFEDTDSVPLAEALEQRLVGWCERAAAQLSRPERDWCLRNFLADDIFAGVQRVPCHRDYHPRNWLFAGTAGEGSLRASPQLSVIDFEHAGPDLWLIDVVRMWEHSWQAEPSLQDNFFEGYGRRLDEVDRARLQRVGILHAVGSIAWGAEHEDQAYENQGRMTLRRLQDELG